MEVMKKLVAILTVAVLVTGCASVSSEKWQDCALTGAAMGSAAGGFGDDHDRSDLIAGAIGGAIVGATICALLADDTKPVAVDDTKPVAVDDTKPVTVTDTKPVTVTDSDNDGVADYKDQCPNSVAGAVVNELGCAKPLLLENINFHTNSADLTEKAKGVLQQIAVAHQKHHGKVNLLISGHTDSQGTVAYNQSLSQRRAEAVVAFMVKHGFKASKLTAVGFGENQAIANNGTKEGRAANRRVELSVK